MGGSINAKRSQSDHEFIFLLFKIFINIIRSLLPFVLLHLGPMYIVFNFKVGYSKANIYGTNFSFCLWAVCAFEGRS